MIALALAVGFALGWTLKGDTLWSLITAAHYWRSEALAYELDLRTRDHGRTVPWRAARRPILAEPWPLRLVRRVSWPGWPREPEPAG